MIQSASIRVADYTGRIVECLWERKIDRFLIWLVLRFESRGICENFKYVFDPFAIIFMDKLYKSLAYRKDFQVNKFVFCFWVCC